MRAASAVPRLTLCSTKSNLVESPDSWVKVSATSFAWLPTTTTTPSRLIFSSAFKMRNVIGTPSTRCRGFGSVDRIREPSPAARTIALMRSLAE